METKTETNYELVTLTSDEVAGYLENHNWQAFQTEGHFISATMPKHLDCPACKHVTTMHSPADIEKYHSGDRIWCLSLFTPGTAPDSPKGTGLQILRVQDSSREGVIAKMRTAMLDSIYAHGRQQYSMHLDWTQYHELKVKMDALTTFMVGNLHLPSGASAYEIAGRMLREQFLSIKGTTELPTDNNEMLPLSWRRP